MVAHITTKNKLEAASDLLIVIFFVITKNLHVIAHVEHLVPVWGRCKMKLSHGHLPKIIDHIVLQKSSMQAVFTGELPVLPLYL